MVLEAGLGTSNTAASRSGRRRDRTRFETHGDSGGYSHPICPGRPGHHRVHFAMFIIWEGGIGLDPSKIVEGRRYYLERFSVALLGISYWDWLSEGKLADVSLKLVELHLHV